MFVELIITTHCPTNVGLFFYTNVKYWKLCQAMQLKKVWKK